MIHMRTSRPEDIPRLRELWRLAFGDPEAYMDAFFQCWYRPERMLVLEEEGELRSMLAWFDTWLDVPDGNRWKAGYLYAVATHPDRRGQGLSGALQKYAAAYLRGEQGCQAMTTVPANPSLHRFFAANGFRECFTHSVRVWDAPVPEGEPPFRLERLSAADYGRAREAILSGTAHISYPEQALAFQEEAGALSPGGGLYAAGAAVLCAEEGERGLVIKELLGKPEDVELALRWAGALLPGWTGEYRTPGSQVPFGMLQWLYPGLERRWDWSSSAYLGLAFD